MYYLLTTEQLADLERSAFLLSEEIQNQQITVSDIEFIPWNYVNDSEKHKSENHSRKAKVTSLRLCKLRYK